MKKWVNPEIMELGVRRTECEETGIRAYRFSITLLPCFRY